MDPSILTTDYAYRVSVIRILQLAASVAGLYDHLLTLDAEVRYIWKKKWSALKCIFLFNRYLSTSMLIANLVVFMSDSISQHFCNVYIRLQAVTTVLLILGVQTIMQYRLYAIYEGNRTVLLALLSLWLAQIIALGTILGLGGASSIITSTSPPFSLPPSYSLCTPTHTPTFLPALWLPVILFESVLVILAVYRGFTHIIQFAKYGDWWCPKLLSAVLVRDSILYFGLNLVTYSATAVVWFIGGRSGWIEAPEGICVTLTAVMGARIVLNLREAYHDAPQTVTFATTTAAGEPTEDIGWAPKEGKRVTPMWWMKPIEGRMRKKGIIIETPGVAVIGRPTGYAPPPRRRRKPGQLESAIAFAGPGRRRASADSDSDVDSEDGEDQLRRRERMEGHGSLAIPEQIRTRPGNGDSVLDLEGSPTTLVGRSSRAAPWRSRTTRSTPASSLISGGSTASGGSIGVGALKPEKMVEEMEMSTIAQEGTRKA